MQKFSGTRAEILFKDEVGITFGLFKLDKSPPCAAAPVERMPRPPIIRGSDWGRQVGAVRGTGEHTRSEILSASKAPSALHEGQCAHAPLYLLGSGSHAPPSTLKGLEAASGFYFLFFGTFAGQGCAGAVEEFSTRSSRRVLSCCSVSQQRKLED